MPIWTRTGKSRFDGEPHGLGTVKPACSSADVLSATYAIPPYHPTGPSLQTRLRPPLPRRGVSRLCNKQSVAGRSHQHVTISGSLGPAALSFPTQITSMFPRSFVGLDLVCTNSFSARWDKHHQPTAAALRWPTRSGHTDLHPRPALPTEHHPCWTRCALAPPVDASTRPTGGTPINNTSTINNKQPRSTYQRPDAGTVVLIHLGWLLQNGNPRTPPRRPPHPTLSRQ